MFLNTTSAPDIVLCKLTPFSHTYHTVTQPHILPHLRPLNPTTDSLRSYLSPSVAHLKHPNDPIPDPTPTILIRDPSETGSHYTSLILTTSGVAKAVTTWGGRPSITNAPTPRKKVLGKRFHNSKNWGGGGVVPGADRSECPPLLRHCSLPLPLISPSVYSSLFHDFSSTLSFFTAPVSSISPISHIARLPDFFIYLFFFSFF